MKRVKIVGIYRITSKVKPQRIYVGSSEDIQTRWVEHLKKLRLGVHHSRKLQNHYNKYGKDDLIFSIITTCDVTELLSQEQFFIDSLKPWFNLAPIAGSAKGVKRSAEWIQRHREILLDPDHPMRRPECRRKASETKKKNGSMLGNKNPFFGKHHKKESIDKANEKRIGRIQSPEERAMRTIALQKRWDNTSEERKKQIIAPLLEHRYDRTGSKHTERWKKDQSIRSKESWRKRKLKNK